jgi:hypothetical protein
VIRWFKTAFTRIQEQLNSSGEANASESLATEADANKLKNGTTAELISFYRQARAMEMQKNRNNPQPEHTEEGEIWSND